MSRFVFSVPCSQLIGELIRSCKDRHPHAAEACLEAASTFNVLLSKYRSSHSLPLSNPHLIYFIFTVAIAHISGYRQLDDDSTTVSLQTQLHLVNCLEAFKMIGQTWDLAGRCWRTLDRLMDMEGMNPRSGQDGGAGSMLGKRKRRDTSYISEQRQQRASLVPSATASTSYDSSVQSQYLSPSSSGGQGQNIPGLWASSLPIPSAAPSSSMPTATTASASMTDIFFDPDFFSSNTGWMSELQRPDPLEGIWNASDWNEDFWSSSFHATPAKGAGAMEGDFVLDEVTGAVDLTF